MSVTQKTLENLFVSKVRVKALKFFMLNPDETLHLRGAVREFDEEINAVRRELTRLEDVKFLTSEAKGNKKYFKLNKTHPLLNEISGIIHKTYGLGGEIIDNLSKLGEVHYALLTSNYTRGVKIGSQPVDFVIVGNIDMETLHAIISRAEAKLGKEINYTVLRPQELELRKRRRDQFILDLMLQDNVMLVGSHEDFVSNI